MTAPHRARPEQWAAQEAFRDDDDDASCLLELRDRVLAMHACVCDIYEQLDRLKTDHESNWSRIVKLEEGPAVTEARGPVASDVELYDLYNTYDTLP